MARDRSRRSRVPALLLTLIVVACAVALAAVRGPHWVERFQHPLTHQAAIADAASAEHIDPYVVAAVINVESGFRDGVVSSAGAVGLMQVKPSTAKAVARRLGIEGKMNEAALVVPETNIRVGTAYLAELMTRYGGSVDLALAAYNAGMSNADHWAIGWVPAESTLSASIDFPETAHYVDEVLAQAETYRSLYPDAFPKSGK